MERVRGIIARPDWPYLSGLALALVGLLEALLYSGDEVAATVLLTLMATLPLMVRETHLKTAVATTTLATICLLASDATPETGAGLVAQASVLYLLAQRYRGWVTLAVGIPYILLLLAAQLNLYNTLLLASGIGALGVGRSRRLTEQVTAVKAGQAVLEERARIARELHDVVAHHVSTIAIQADTARLTTPGMPPEGGEKLQEIGQTARDAMTEMRRVLGVLRTEPGEREPQPGLDRLPELLETARSTGTPVRLVLEGAMAPLAPGVDLTAYRVIQEGLTNARRHAPGAAVDVELRYDAAALRLRVRDNGPGSVGAVSDGQGLVGMRERVTLAGGELLVGPADGGGFLVEASLPL